MSQHSDKKKKKTDTNQSTIHHREDVTVNDDKNIPTFSWSAYEHVQGTEKGQDWFWSLGFIAVASAVAAILLGNTLFAILILAGAVALGLTANQKVNKKKYSISVRGITINNILYSYKVLESFWIDESHPHRDMLIVDARQLFTPHVIIHLPDDFDKDALQDFLLDYLPEKRLQEPVAHRLAELFGI
jgi:hypothetical protein